MSKMPKFSRISFTDCMRAQLAAGDIDAGRFEDMMKMHESFQTEAGRRHYEGLMASDWAARKTRERMDEMARLKKRNLILKTQTALKLDSFMKSYAAARGQKDYGEALTSIFDPKENAQIIPGSIQYEREFVRGQLMAGMTDVLYHFRKTVTGGGHNRADMPDVVREIFAPGSTGNKAVREYAEAWLQTAENARQWFNRVGGNIGKLEDWGLPQHHDAGKIMEAGFVAWRDFIKPLVDTGRMLDEATGLPLSEERIGEALRSAYNSITTNGWSKVDATKIKSRRFQDITARRSEHRFLHFKDADSWLKYQKAFGSEDLMGVMTGHLEGMARDIAILKTLGPNPHAMLGHLETVVMKHAAELDAAGGSHRFSKKARSAIHLSRAMFDDLRGATNTPVNTDLAAGMAATRNIIMSAQLGAAAVSSITDVNTMRIAAKMVGLDRGKVIQRFGQIVGASDNAKIEANRTGFIANNWIRHSVGTARYFGEMWAPEVAARINDSMLQFSGLNQWTDGWKQAFGEEFSAFLAEQAGKKFEHLPVPLQRTLKRYGLEQGWDVLRASPLHEPEAGVKFLRAQDIMNRTDIPAAQAEALASTMMQMIYRETEFAIPSVSLRGRTSFLRTDAPGTFWGEIQRSAAMYKNFGVTMLYTHIGRGLAQAGWGSKAQYMANFLIGSALMGGLALQARQIIDGKDPRPMNTKDFWGAALLQAGGIGIFGDFLFSPQNRFGGGFGGTLAGPVVGLASDFWTLTGGNAMDALAGRDTHFGRDVSRFVRRNMPGGSLWYARLAWNRLVMDQLQRAVDPKAEKNFREIERRWKREFDQGYFWAPGDTLPERAPDLSNAAGGH